MEQINQKDPLRIVLLGKTGVGKSATGNTILGRKDFGVHCSPESVTRKCSANEAIVDGRKVTVIDTPGLYDTSLKTGDLKRRIEELFNNSGDGIHAILLVIKLCNRFTEEEINSVQWIKDNFGEASKNTIVLFTNGDELEYDGIKIEDYINKGKRLKNVIDQYDKRYLVFNNRANDRTQVTELLEKIRVMMKQNKDSLYTKKKYDKAQKKLFIANTVGCITGGLVGAGAVGGTAAVVGAAVVGAAGGTAAVAGAVGGTAAVVGAVKGVVITAAVVGGAGTAVVFGVFGVGAAVYKYYKSKQSAGEKNKEV